MGESRESVDQIVLESHFGIGYGPKMRDLANATVAAAGSESTETFWETQLAAPPATEPALDAAAGKVGELARHGARAITSGRSGSKTT